MPQPAMNRAARNMPMLIDPASRASPKTLIAAVTYSPLPSLRFAHPTDHDSAKRCSRDENAVDCTGDCIVVRAVLPEVEVLEKSGLTEGVGDDAETVAECKATEGEG